MRISFIQPLIPHYRELFFKRISQYLDISIYTTEEENIERLNFKKGAIETIGIKKYTFGKLVLYSPLKIISRAFDINILLFSPTHITTWLLLIYNRIVGRKSILWGHGISIHNYLEEEIKPNFIRKFMIKLADFTFFYTEKELKIWLKEIPSLKGASFDNTLPSNPDILVLSEYDVTLLKEKHSIKGDQIFIYCARFNEPGRRIDLLESIIKESPSNFSFIIIGDGYLKPDFTKYSNVYDFGSVYEPKLKNELFGIADYYFQPAWVGLSIIEAMSYGLPVVTFKRQVGIPQCVEYYYLSENTNAILLEKKEDFNIKINQMTESLYQEMSKNAKEIIERKLTIENMTEKFMVNIKKIKIDSDFS